MDHFSLDHGENLDLTVKKDRASLGGVERVLGAPDLPPFASRGHGKQRPIAFPGIAGKVPIEIVRLVGIL